MRRLLLATFLCSLVGGCAPGSPGVVDDDGDDLDGDEPYEPGAVEGIEEASEALTDLSDQCTYTPSSGLMGLVLNAGDLALVTRTVSGTILVNGFPCHGAIATKLTQLAVTEGTTGIQTLIVDYGGGPFGLGKSNKPGMTVALGADVSADAFKVIGSGLVDSIVLGSAGMTINADGFVDVTFTGADLLVFNMGAGNDSFSAAGSAAAGGPLSGRVEIYGGAGNDVIQGGAGDDVYFGGEGDDTFRAGSGDDGGDEVNGGAGTDTADYAGRSGDLALSIDGVANDGQGGASEGDDLKADLETLKGGSGNDTLIGGAGSQTLQGGPGDDVLRGGAGNDMLSGDAGDDRFDEEASPSGADVLNGGAGIDAADYSARSAAVTVTIDALAGDGQGSEGDKVGTDVENVTGGSGDDRLTGSVGANVLAGGGGADTLLGADGADVLSGGEGADTLDGGPGNDRLDAEATPGGGDTLRGGAGVDLVDYSARTAAVDVTMDGVTPSGESGEADKVGADVENLRGGPEGDALRGNSLDNLIEGGGGDDNLYGLAGDDVIDGDAGDDVIDCGAGEADILLDRTTASADGCEL